MIVLLRAITDDGYGVVEPLALENGPGELPGSQAVKVQPEELPGSTAVKAQPVELPGSQAVKVQPVELHGSQAVNVQPVDSSETQLMDSESLELAVTVASRDYEGSPALAAVPAEAGGNMSAHPYTYIH